MTTQKQSFSFATLAEDSRVWRYLAMTKCFDGGESSKMHKLRHECWHTAVCNIPSHLLYHTVACISQSHTHRTKEHTQIPNQNVCRMLSTTHEMPSPIILQKCWWSGTMASTDAFTRLIKAFLFTSLFSLSDNTPFTLSTLPYFLSSTHACYLHNIYSI